jgi:hypothetical protein
VGVPDFVTRAVNVCVTVTVLVTPVGNVVSLTVALFIVLLVLDSEADLDLGPVIEAVTEAVCVFETLELLVTVAVRIFVLVWRVVDDTVTDCVDVLETADDLE